MSNNYRNARDETPGGSSHGYTTVEHEGPEPTYSDYELTDTFYDQVTKLEVTLQEIKTTVDRFLSGAQVQRNGRLGLNGNNHETRRRIKLDNTGFTRLNTWLRSGTDILDILKHYLWLDEDDFGLKESTRGEDTDAYEHETPIPQSEDFNKKLSYMCSEGFTALNEEFACLHVTNGDEAEKPTSLLMAEGLMEESDRFNLWASNTKVKNGALYILVNNDLYKHTQRILEGILVDLIRLGEEGFVDESGFPTGGSLGQDRIWLTPWLKNAKALLEILPRKSDKVHEYLSSYLALPSTPLNGGQGELGEELAADHTPNVLHRTRHHHSNRNPQESSVEGEPQSQTEVQTLRPTSRSSKSSFSFEIDDRNLVDYLLDNLKESNDTLFYLAKDLEMAKASLGEGTHSQLYQAVRKIESLPKGDTPAIAVDASSSSLITRPYTPTQSIESDRKATLAPHSPTPRNINIPRAPEPNPSTNPRRSKVYQPETERSKKYPAQERSTRAKEYPEYPEEPQAPNDSKYSRSTLWDKVHTAALTDAKTLPSLLYEFEDIGFGLYCDREGTVLDALCLDKWVALEILTCMWRGTSQHMKDSFRRNAQKSLSTLKLFDPEPQMSRNPSSGQRGKLGNLRYMSYGPAASGRYGTNYQSDDDGDMPKTIYTGQAIKHPNYSFERHDTAKGPGIYGIHHSPPTYPTTQPLPGLSKPISEYMSRSNSVHPSYQNDIRVKGAETDNFVVDPIYQSYQGPRRSSGYGSQNLVPPQKIVGPPKTVGLEKNKANFVEAASSANEWKPTAHLYSQQFLPESRNTLQEMENQGPQTQEEQHNPNPGDQKGKDIPPQRPSHRRRPREPHSDEPISGGGEDKKSEH